MNKRIKFLISITLIFALFVSSFMLPASSYANDIRTSTDKLLLVNVDTNTEVFSKDADTKWFAGYLSELMTFIVASEQLGDLQQTKFRVQKGYADSLPVSDGCLSRYVGLELTAKDLMGIMLITSGNDAAYALADLSTNGDIGAFVTLMNERAQSYGMQSTNFVSPGYSSSDQHLTTCRDLYRLYLRLLQNDLYQEIMDQKSYIPEGLYVEGDDARNERYTVYPEASVINDDSPYYFKYVDSAKLSLTPYTKSNIALSTIYRESRYFLAGMNGLNESERNVYADTRKLVTWAYLNLSDRKLISEDQKLGDAVVRTGWGEYPLDLYPPSPVVKTLPDDYDEKKLSYSEELEDEVKTPLRKGEMVGNVRIFYDGEAISNVWMTSKTEEGLSMVPDCGRFGSYVFKQLMPNIAQEPTEADELLLLSGDVAQKQPTSVGATEG